MKLTLGFSTCPNDTFIFAPIYCNLVDTKGLEFDFILRDIEILNEMAFDSKLDITKISFHAYAYIWEKYKILDSGSALGRNNGPLLISAKDIDLNRIEDYEIAVPGFYTTANLLLYIAFPKAFIIEYLFSDIPKAILNNEVDAGVIIHETRFTYQKMGLKKILDLGQYWENLTNLPVPLGGIIIKRDLPLEVQKTFEQVLLDSIKYSLQNPYKCLNFIKDNAQEITEEVMFKHIKLYVNEFTLHLTDEGRKSIEKLYELGYKVGFLKQLPKNIFL